MKKILYSIFVVVLSFILVACAPSDEEKLQEYIGKITVQTEATENFYLPSVIDNLTDHSISWESSNTDVIRIGNLANIDGVNYYTANVKRAEEDVEVELTAIVELASGLSSQKSFRVKVIKAEKEEIQYITVSEALSSKLNAVVVVKGVVSGFHYGTYQEQPSIQGCYLTDETGTIYVYGYILAQSVEKGDEIIIEAKVAEYKTFKQLSEPSLVEAVSKGNNISVAGAKTDKTVAQISADLSTNYTGAAYIFEGVQIKKLQGSDYISYVLEDKDGKAINLYSSGNSSEFAWLDQYTGKELKVLFAINSQNSAGTKWRGHVLDVLEVVGDWNGSSQGGGNNNPGGTTGAKVSTVSEVLALAASLADQAKLEGEYQVTGVVTKIDTPFNSQYGNITFTLSDGTKEILCYRTYGDLAASVAVGDTVTVVGEVQNYSGTIEFVYADVTARTAGQGGGTENPGEGNTPEPGTLLTVKDAIGCAIGVTVKVQGVVSGFHKGTQNDANAINGFYLTDETGTIYVFGSQTAQQVNKGDKITIEATTAEYKTFKQLSSPNLIETISTGNEISAAGAVTNKTVAQIAADLSTDYTAAAYVFEGVQIVKVDGGSYINYIIEDKDGNAINLYSGGNSNEFAVYDQYIGKELKVLFAINSQNSKGTKWRGHILDVLEVIGDWSGSTENPGGGTENPGEGNTPVVTGDFLKEVQVGVAYKFVIDQTGVGKKFFFTGTMSGYYGASSENASDAVNVFLEENGDGYNLYFMDGSSKKYIVIAVSGTHYNFTIADSASSVWAFDTTYYTLTTIADGVKIYMGTYGTFVTFGGSDYDKYIATSYPARFYPENTTGGNPGGNTGENPEGGNNNQPSGDVEGAIVLDFVKTFGTYASNWGSSYGAHTVSNADLGVSTVVSVEFTRANKQTSGNAIDDRPVIAANASTEYVVVEVEEGNIKVVQFELNKWTTKTFNSIVIEYFDGANWVACSNSITTPSTLTSSELANGVTQVRLAVTTTASKNTQVGLASISLVIE